MNRRSVVNSNVSHRRPPRPPRRLQLGNSIPDWLFGDSAGISISGDAGSGKSNALECLLQSIIRATGRLTSGSLSGSGPPGLLFLDPHGQSARRLRRFCLSLGPSVARRMLYIQPSNTKKIVSINALHVPGSDAGSLAWYGRLTVITEFVSKILLAAWGEVDFNSKPILYKNVFRIVYTLAHAGLSLADAKLFLDTFSAIYRTICQACPDLIARQEMEDLPDMRQADRLAQLESAKNRFLGLLSNPIVEAILGKVDGALNMQQIYNERLIVIVNLETGGVLRTMDQEILANLWLTLALATIMNTPAQYRYPYFIGIDELPVFGSSSDLLISNLAQQRKFLVRTIGCFQGANAFPNRTEDRLLNSFLSQCRTHLYFRHSSEQDCAFFGKHIALSDYNPLRVKHILKQSQQYQDGQDLVTLVDEAEGVSEGQESGGSTAHGTTATDSWNKDTSNTQTASTGRSRDEQLLRDTVSEARAEARADRAGTGGSSGTTATSGSNWSNTRSRSVSRTRKQTLVPRLKWREIVASIQFFTKEEQDAMKATTIACLRTGHAMLHVAGLPAAEVAFPLASDRWAKTPIFARKKEAEHQTMLELRPEFDTIEAVQEQRQRILNALLRRLSEIVSERPTNPTLLPPVERLPPPLPPKKPDADADGSITI